MRVTKTKLFKTHPLLAKAIFIAVFSAIIATLMLFAVSNELPVKQDLNFTIKFTGEKNEKASLNEVWLKYFIVDGNRIPAAKVVSAAGWEPYAGYLHAYGAVEDKEELVVSFSNIGTCQMVISQAEAEGILQLQADGQQQKIDLFSSEATDSTYSVTMGFTPHQSQILWPFLVAFAATAALAVLILWSRKFLAVWQLFLCVALTVYSHAVFYADIDVILLIILSVLGGILLPFAQKNQVLKNLPQKPLLVGVVILSAYTAFAFAGQPLILKDLTVDISIHTISYLVLLSLLFASVIYSAMYLLCVLKQKVVVDRDTCPFKSRGKWWILFGIMAAIYGIWMISCWPGNYPSDAAAVWDTVHGHQPYWLGIPYYYYQSLRFLSIICNSVSFVIYVQCLFFAAVCTSILIFLCKKGLSWRVAVGFAIVFSFLPSNGIGQVTMVKDYPVATALLWLTYLIVKLVVEKEKFVTPLNLTALSAALFMVAFFRLNGILTFFVCLVVIFFLVRAWPKGKKLIARALCGGLAVLFMIMYFPVQTFYAGTARHISVENNTVWMVGDQLAGVVAGEQRLSPATEQWMEQYMTLEDWKQAYRPYNLNPWPEEHWTKFLEQNSISSVLPVLLESAVKAPLLTIKTRLNKMNILWDITPVPENQAYMYVAVYQNAFGLEKQENPLSNALIKYFGSPGLHNDLMMRLAYNNGICLVLILILWLYLTLRKKKALRWMFVAVLANILSLVVSCNWQDYRYYYAVMPIAAFAALFTLCSDVLDVKLDERVKELSSQANKKEL